MSLSRRFLIRRLRRCAALALAGCNKAGGGAAAGDAMIPGPGPAKVNMDEYASTTCSHCGRFNNDVFPAFKAKYIDTGKVQLHVQRIPDPAARTWPRPGS